ncbi:anti-sigma factor [Calycomorphotria hydatis]|uniref:Uncharacterized protein n=1 Tax=Calycomorphotria hydatis TaxID=2528027 RepID=A0A517T808_9PLAN|nr:hypothetical protein [Calycomorphotria hydatis]QDT64503.1 hypothetical protein V22_17370 [Calycomorphotria hydatis]
MSDDYVDRMINAYLDNALSTEEQDEFESLVLRSEFARRRFWELAEVHGLASQAARSAWPDLDDSNTSDVPAPKSVSRSPIGEVRTRSSSRRSAFVLASGVVIGVLMSSIGWAITGLSQSPIQLDLLIDQFEGNTLLNVTGIPTQPDRWSGDFNELVTSQQDVQPLSGEKMVRVLRADYLDKPHPEGSYCGDLFRLVDLRNYQEMLINGDVVTNASAMFNTAHLPKDERYLCSVGIIALSADIVEDIASIEIPMLEQYALAMSRKATRLDKLPETWQQGQSDLKLPPETDYLLIHISVSYNHSTEALRRITFPGHYIDDFHLSLSRPSR